MHTELETAQERREPEETFSIPYALKGSRHDRVLGLLVDQQRERFPDELQDKTDASFDSADAYMQFFENIVGKKRYDASQVMVSEFYLFDPSVTWRDETAMEVDIACFDLEKQTVYCIETTGKNLECVEREEQDRKQVVRQEALAKGEDAIDRLQDYMSRFGWDVNGHIATFYQHGKLGRTDVELYRYAPEGKG